MSNFLRFKNFNLFLVILSLFISCATSLPILDTDIKPNLTGAGTTADTANSEGWYETMNEDFSGVDLPDKWNYIESGNRFGTNYWCDNSVEIKDGKAIVHVEKLAEHQTHCSVDHNKRPYIAGGLITCDTQTEPGKRGASLFEQAFGYYEARLKLPDTDGTCAAFWLQCHSIRQLGHGGKDGSEIDIFEGDFYNKKTLVGNCVIYEGYGPQHVQNPKLTDVGVNTYEGYHTYGLKWTPTDYVFYFDGKPIWKTNARDSVCQVPCFIILSCHVFPIHPNGGNLGAYGWPQGPMTGGDYYIDYVKVYQNKNFEPYIKSPEDFK